MKLRIAVRRLPVVFWSSIYVDPTNHGLRRSIPSNPVDPIQPRYLTNSELRTQDSEIALSSELISLIPEL